jgi:6-phosphofructo-2-kinase/fructose-2,6-biphosphatase 4
MACDAMHIPKLKFPRNEIIEVSYSAHLHLSVVSHRNLTCLQIIPASYQNEAKRINIPDVHIDMIPGSPEDIRIPVPPSGFVSPLSGLGTPAEPATSMSKVVTPSILTPGEKAENPLSRETAC